MPISYVGGQEGGRAGSTATSVITFNLTGGSNTTPQANDFVIITAVVGSQGRNPAQAISGYTALGQLNPTATTYDTSLNVSYKRMGSTPDTTFTLPSTRNIADAQSWTVQVFRGVDPTTPFDVSSVPATGTGTSRPNPASISPSTAGAWIVICGGGAAQTGANYTAPANFTTNFLTGFDADTNDSLIGSGYWSGWTSGSVDPAAYTGGSNTANDSWAVYTIALRPEPSTQTLLPGLTTNTQTFYGPTVTAGTVNLQPGLTTNTQTFYSPTVTPGTVNLQPGLTTNNQTFYNPTVSATADLAPSLVTNTQTFYGPTVTAGTVDLQPNLLNNTQTFFNAAISQTGGLEGAFFQLF